MPQTYFTADWHFSHPNIARYCPQFRLQSDNADELNEYLIDCWNRVVTPQDTVYNLGDVCFAKKPAHIEAVLQRLNGQHHLIYGNHDYLIRQNEAHFLNTRKADGHPLLSSASHYLRLKLPEIGNTAILCHCPLYEWDGIHQRPIPPLRPSARPHGRRQRTRPQCRLGYARPFPDRTRY